MPDDPRKTRERIESLLRKALTLTQKLPQPESVQEAAAPYDPSSSHYRVARYPYSRFYALYDGGCSRCYLKPLIKIYLYYQRVAVLTRKMGIVFNASHAKKLHGGLKERILHPFYPYRST